jgi:hypothetical protein
MAHIVISYSDTEHDNYIKNLVADLEAHNIDFRIEQDTPTPNAIDTLDEFRNKDTAEQRRHEIIQQWDEIGGAAVAMKRQFPY